MDIKYPKINFKLLIPLDIDGVTAIVLHHILAKNATVEEIHEWHLANGWSGIGYNEYIRKDGTIYICRGDFVGSHCQGQNSKSYGIAVEGDYSQELIMPSTQKQVLIERIRYHQSRLPHLIGIFPHSYFGNSNCPGKNFPLAEVLGELEKADKKVDEAYKNCVDVVAKELELNTPEYWYKHQDVNVHRLITLMANRLYELTGQLYK